MRSSLRRLLLCVAGICVVAHGGTGVSRAAAPQEPATLPTQTQNATYLPLLAAPARVSQLRFATAIDEQGAPVDPADSFAYGTTELFASVLIEGAENAPYRLEITIPTGEVVPSSGEVPSNAYYAVLGICLIPPGATCEAGPKLPLPDGTYHARLYLSGDMLREQTAMVQAGAVNATSAAGHHRPAVQRP